MTPDESCETTPWPTERPLLIAFEGLDGSGKTTLAQRTAELSGALFMTTPSPPIRAYRERLLDDLGPSQEARQLFYLATVFVASEQLRGTLARGRSGVIDRYFLSTQAYAQFRGSRLDVDELETNLVPADLTIYVDAPLEIRRDRVGRRGASVADLETLTPEADLRLRELHLRRRSLAVVGQLTIIDSSAATIAECVEQVRLAAWRAARSR